MAIYIGSQKVIPHGIAKVYVGPNKVYEKSVAPSYDAVLANNTWDQIKAAVDAGTAPSLGWLGQVKDGWQLADLTANRYVKTDGTGSTNAVFVRVSEYGSSYYGRYDGTNWGNITDYTSACDSCYTYLASDIKAVVSQCKVKYTTQPSSTTGKVTTRDCTVFMPSWSEMYGAGNLNEGPMFEYMTTNDIRKRTGSNGALLRTRVINSTPRYYRYINASNGAIATAGTLAKYSLCLAFAI